MKSLLNLEEFAQFALAFVLYLHTGDNWWYFFLWLLAPDLSMLGYLFGPVVGAWTYNLAHHKAIGIGLFLIGLYTNHELITTAGLILFGHSAMDRIFGYGLKFTDSFGHTHLGWIGKHKN